MFIRQSKLVRLSMVRLFLHHMSADMSVCKLEILFQQNYLFNPDQPHPKIRSFNYFEQYTNVPKNSFTNVCNILERHPMSCFLGLLC